jgi:hypothetical protein
MNTKLSKILLAGAVVAFGFSMRVMADSVVLLPGTSAALVIATNGPGSTLVTSESSNFSSVTINGSVNAFVLRNFADNPWASAGGLTFVYQVNSSPTSVDTITGLGIDGWLGYLTDVAYYPDAAGAINPQFGTRSLDGYTVTFGWQNPPLGSGLIRPGFSGDEVVIYSNATNWDLDTGGVRDGSGVTMTIIGPAGIPDGGTTALLLGFGLLGISWAVRRSKKS